MRYVARSELGIPKLGRRKVDKHSLLWTNEVKENVCEKKRLYRAFLSDKTADKRRLYDGAKKSTKIAVAVAIATHYDDVYMKLESRDGELFLYRLAMIHLRSHVEA